jgi:hypothetical protein
MNMDRTCQCHLIDWSGGPGNYKILSTGEKLDYSGGGPGYCCQTKVNDGIINMEKYEGMCQYIPGKPGSKFPQEVFNAMLAIVPVSSLEGIPPIPEHIFEGKEDDE